MLQKTLCQILTQFRVIGIRLILVAGLILCANISFAQLDEEIVNLRPSQLKKAARKSAKENDYYSAIEYYKLYLKQKPEKTKIVFEMAENYRLSRDYFNAALTYQAVLKLDSAKQKYPLAQYHLAVMQKMTGNCEDAIVNFLAFKKAYKKGKDARIYKKLVAANVSGCDSLLALAYEERGKFIRINHLDSSINKAYMEMSPFPINDTAIIYASLKADSLITLKRNNNTVQTTFSTLIPSPVAKLDTTVDTSTTVKLTRKFYYANKIDGYWQGSEMFDAPFNKLNANVGNGAFTPDMDRFFFTKCEMNLQQKMICSIYVSEYDGGEWTEPVKLPEPINSTKYTTTQPTVGYDEKNGYPVIYFVSDRPGGKGGMDIWYTVYNPTKNEYKAPKNAGSKLNTVGDEVTPYYNQSSRSMFFSSNGWPGMGGLDIQRVNGEMKKWTPVYNLGSPINSSVDDLYYVILPNKEGGFFVSNREGSIALKNETCCDDLYSYEYVKYIYIAIKGIPYETSRKHRIDEVGNSPIPGRGIMLDSVEISMVIPSDSVEGGADNYTMETIITQKDGGYFFKLEPETKYTFVASKEGYFNNTFNFNTGNVVESDTLEQPIGLTKKTIGPIVIPNVYYEFDKAVLTEGSKITIDTTVYDLMIENPEIIVEIGSHTDSKGSDSYNETLSTKRAISVINYLMEKGIEGKRLRAKGYGEKVPIEPNTHPDGTDNPEGRQMNRRTEFRIVGEVEGVSKIIYVR